MKKLAIFFLFALTPFFSFAQLPEWKKVDSCWEPSRLFYLNLKCADSLNCMIHISWNGDSGFLYRTTTNGGLSWENVYNDTTNISSDAPQMKDMAYPDTNLFIAVGDSGKILRTTDKGISWDTVVIDKKKNLYMVRMLNKNYGILLAGDYDKKNEDGKFFKTLDGGISWYQIKTPEEFWHILIEDFDIINDSIFVMITGWRDIDSLWKPVLLWVKGNWDDYYYFSRNKGVFDMDFIDEKKGWVCGGTRIAQFNQTQLIQFTEDSGRTWITQRDTLINGYDSDGIEMFDEKNGIVGTGKGKVIITYNGGKTWNLVVVDSVPKGSGDPVLMRCIQFPSITTAYVICNKYNASIYKYTRDWSVVADEQENEGYNVSLYPNPVSETLNISLTKDMYGETEVSLIDIHGRTITSFKTREFTSSIDVSSLPPGVYGVVVRFGKNVVGKRVSVIR